VDVGRRIEVRGSHRGANGVGIGVAGLEEHRDGIDAGLTTALEPFKSVGDVTIDVRAGYGGIQVFRDVSNGGGQ